MSQSKKNTIERTHIYNLEPIKPINLQNIIEQIPETIKIMANLQQQLQQGSKIKNILGDMIPILKQINLGFVEVNKKLQKINEENQHNNNENKGNERQIMDQNLYEGINLVYMEKFCENFSVLFLLRFKEIFQKICQKPCKDNCALIVQNNNDNNKKGIFECYNEYKKVRDCMVLNNNESHLMKHLDEILGKFKIIQMMGSYQIWDRFQVEKNDIIGKPLEHWEKIDQKIEYKHIFESEECYKKQMDSFLHMISLTNSVQYYTHGTENKKILLVKQLMYSAYFKFFRSKSFQATQKFLGETDQKLQDEVAIKTWNGLESMKFSRYWMQVTLPGIKYHKKFYIHKIFEEIGLEKALKWVNGDKILQKEKLIKKNQNTLTCTNIQKKTNKTDKVKVRILCSENIIEYKEEKSGLLNYVKNTLFQNKSQQQQDNKKVIDKVILHIHGGGWVSMSSFSHQMYTRRWANYEELKGIPIISIDYRKSPEYPYPCPLEDCWQAYLFVLYEMKNYFNIDPKKIILVGDSAGGNMALGICQLCQKYDIQQPDGLFLAYPGVNLTDHLYTPSMNYTLTDLIVPFPFLTLCLKSYMQDERCDPTKDSLLSPLFMKKKQLKKLPPVRIILGENDCLKDDGVRFLHALVESEHQDNQLIIYKGLKHGFLNWDIPLAMPLTRQCTLDSAEMITDLFQSS